MRSFLDRISANPSGIFAWTRGGRQSRRHRQDSEHRLQPESWPAHCPLRSCSMAASTACIFSGESSTSPALTDEILVSMAKRPSGRVKSSIREAVSPFLRSGYWPARQGLTRLSSRGARRSRRRGICGCSSGVKPAFEMTTVFLALRLSNRPSQCIVILSGAQRSEGSAVASGNLTRRHFRIGGNPIGARNDDRT